MIISLSRILSHCCAERPDAIAIAHEESEISFSKLEASSNQLARAYQKLGVQSNDYVLVGLSNGIEFFQACFAIWKLGATPMPVSSELPQIERQGIIEIGKPKLLVGVDESEAGGIRSVPPGFDGGDGLSDAALPEITADSYKVMTSGGSTGRSKLIVAGYPAEWNSEEEQYLNFRYEGVVLVLGPLYHNGPFLWAMGSLFTGNLVVISSRFDAQESLRQIEAHQVDTVYMVPTMMQRIWNLPDEARQKYNLESLRTLWHLAAPCPPWLKEAYIEWLGADCIWELYGGTEEFGTTVISGKEWLSHRGSVGKAKDCEIKIVGANVETLPTGETGEVFMRPITGPGSTYRYVGAQAKRLDGGWESLGDIGRLDEEGYLYLSDRLADMILSGGANVYPAEVEAAIDSMPGVRSSVVVGLPQEDLGHIVHAIVDVPEINVSEEQLINHLSQRLVRYKIPRTIEFVSEPLRDDAGKVRRKQFKEARS